MRQVKLTVLMAALTAGAMQVALASGTDVQPVSRQVNYSDLDVTQASGVKALYHRLVVASGAVCERYEDAELSRMRPYKICVGRALSAAIADINNPLLTSYYESKTGMPGQQVAKLDK
jgi:UrcA family protein